MFHFAKRTNIESLNYTQCHDFTYDQNNYYLTTNGNFIYRFSEDGVLEEKIRTARIFHTITFDKQHNCFWGAVNNRTDMLYQLDRDFKEISYIQTQFQNISRYPISLLSYCNSNNLFLIISNSSLHFIYPGNNAKDCTLSPAFMNLHRNVYGACADYGIELYVTRKDDTSILTAMNSDHFKEPVNIALPSDFQFMSLVMLPDKEKENHYQIKVLGVCERQIAIFEYTLDPNFKAEPESDLEHPSVLPDVFPELMSGSQIDSVLDVHTMSFLQGQRSCQNSGCKPQPSSCCQNSCQHENHCEDTCSRCCHCVSLEILETIACQEAALAHILNAEGEKIQRAVKDARNMDELLRVNNSVQNTIIESCHLELVLYSKLKCALSGCSEGCKCHCSPQPPCSCNPKC